MLDNKFDVHAGHHTLFNSILENSFLKNKHRTQSTTLKKAQCTCNGSSPPEEISRVDGNKMVQNSTRSNTSPRRGLALSMERESRGGSKLCECEARSKLATVQEPSCLSSAYNTLHGVPVGRQHRLR